jgi:hypothetical protein
MVTTRYRQRADYWWSKSVGSDKVHALVCDAVKWLDDHQRYRRDTILDAVRLYGNYDALGLSSAEYARSRSRGELRLNLIRSVVDTLSAHIGTNKTRPMFLTTKGDYGAQTRAKRLNQFSAGQLHCTGFYRKIGPQVFRDACLFGKGFAKVYRSLDGKSVTAERVFPDEILNDDIESKNGDPRQLFQHKEVAREVLCDKYPEHEKLIMGSRLVRRGAGDYHSDLSDPVSVVEAWHLPSSKEATDGRHVITLSEGVLEDGEWTRQSYPFATMDWAPPLIGWMPTALIQELEGIQIEINYLLEKIQELMTLATSQVWVQKGSGVNTSRINNGPFSINEYEGQIPQFMTVQAVSGEYFTHLDRLWQRGFEVAGVSSMSAQSAKPPGLNSAVAQREYKDTQTQRFLALEQAYEDFYLEAAERMIDVAKEIDEAGDGGYEILAKGTRNAEPIKWSDVNLDRDKYIIQAYPTSLLPTTPAAKIETAGELGQQFPELRPYLLSLLDLPDIDAAVSRATAQHQYTERLLERMLENGEYEPPEPLLAPFVKDITVVMIQRYLQAKIDGVPEDRLQLILDWIAQAQDQQVAAPAAQPGGMVPPQQDPMAMPAAPDTGAMPLPAG